MARFQIIYPERLANWNFDCAKAPGFGRRKEVRIALILTSLRSIEPRELSRCPNSNFLTARGIVELQISWRNAPQKPDVNDFSAIVIQADRIWWENIPDLFDPFW